MVPVLDGGPVIGLEGEVRDAAVELVVRSHEREVASIGEL